MVNKILEFDTDDEAIRVLKREAEKLKKCAKKVWRQYLDSYTPKGYVRTGKAEKSIKVGKLKKIDANTYIIEVTFQNNLVYHDSVIRKSEPKGHAVMLISDGWEVKKGKHKNIPRFGHYKGFKYLEKVEEEYNKIKDRRISFEIEWSGKYTKRR